MFPITFEMARPAPKSPISQSISDNDAVDRALSVPSTMLRANLSTSPSLSSTLQGKRANDKRAQNRPPFLTLPLHKSPSRLFHGDHPFLDLPSPPSPSGLLPCPPTSPSGRKSVRLTLQKSAINPLRRILKDSPPLAWLSERLARSGTPSPAVWITLYFVFNLSLTLYNKYVLIHFPFPYTLTALHALCGTVGTFAMLHLELLPDQPPVPSLNLRETGVVLLFSLLYTVNIVVSNASLKLVTVPFHQVVRGSTPLFTIALSAVLFKKGASKAKLLSLLPVIAGVGLATYGDYYCTIFGFLLTLLGTLLAAFKTVTTNLILRTSSSQPKEDRLASKHRKVPSIFKYKSPADRFPSFTATFNLPQLTLTPMQLLYLMSPLAFIQTTLLAYFTGELNAVNRHLTVPLSPYHQAHRVANLFGIGMPSWWLIINGVMAFGLNVVSFYSNKRIGPVGMSVAANVKQVLTVLCAVILFELTISAANGVGIGLTLLGGAWYAHLEVKEKREEKRSG